MNQIDSEAGVSSGRDPLGRAVRVALAIYLMPVIAVVCAIGGASIAFGHASALATRLVAGKPKPAWPGPHLGGGSIRAAGGPTAGRVRLRVRG